MKSRLAKNINFKKLDFTSFEAVELQLSINKLSAKCICLYRLHKVLHKVKHTKVNFPIFLSEFTDHLSNYASSTVDVSILGDFNLHYDNSSDSYVKRTNSVLSDFGFSQLVDRPTHKLNHILDWVVVCKDKTLIIYDDVIEYPGLSDHFAIFGRVNVTHQAKL